MDKKGIAYNSIRRVLKTHLKCEVTSEYVEIVKGIIDDIIKDLAYASISQLQETNKLRALHNLRTLKRIDKSMLVKEGILREPTENIIYILDANISYQ